MRLVAWTSPKNLAFLPRVTVPLHCKTPLRVPLMMACWTMMGAEKVRLALFAISRVCAVSDPLKIWLFLMRQVPEQ